MIVNDISLVASTCHATIKVSESQYSATVCEFDCVNSGGKILVAPEERVELQQLPQASELTETVYERRPILLGADEKVSCTIDKLYLH